MAAAARLSVQSRMMCCIERDLRRGRIETALREFPASQQYSLGEQAEDTAWLQRVFASNHHVSELNPG